MMWGGFVLHKVVVFFIYVQSGDGWDAQWIGFHPSPKTSGHFAPSHFSLCVLLFPFFLFLFLWLFSPFYFPSLVSPPPFLQFVCFKFLCFCHLSLSPPFGDLFFLSWFYRNVWKQLQRRPALLTIKAYLPLPFSPSRLIIGNAPVISSGTSIINISRRQTRCGHALRYARSLS